MQRRKEHRPLDRELERALLQQRKTVCPPGR